MKGEGVTVTTGWINEHYAFGWYLLDDGMTVAMDDPAYYEHTPMDPVSHDGDTPVYAPLRQRIIDHGEMTAICRACGDPAWAVTRHAAELHGVDVEVLPHSTNAQRPDWFAPHWI